MNYIYLYWYLYLHPTPQQWALDMEPEQVLILNSNKLENLPKNTIMIKQNWNLVNYNSLTTLM